MNIRYRVNRPPGPVVVVEGVRYFPGDEFVVDLPIGRVLVQGEKCEPSDTIGHYLRAGAITCVGPDPQPGASPSATGTGSAASPPTAEPVSPSESEMPEWSGPDVADTIDIEPTVIDPGALEE